MWVGTVSHRHLMTAIDTGKDRWRMRWAAYILRRVLSKIHNRTLIWAWLSVFVPQRTNGFHDLGIAIVCALMA